MAWLSLTIPLALSLFCISCIPAIPLLLAVSVLLSVTSVFSVVQVVVLRTKAQHALG